MGVTQFHYASQLLDRAGSPITFQALLPPSQQLVLVNGTSFTQTEVNRYSWCLGTGLLGKWIRQTPERNGVEVTTPAPGMRVLLIRVSPGLAVKNTDKPWTRYILVVQGATEMDSVKVYIEHSREGAATTMMHNALNGFSTVFAAAFDNGASPDDMAGPEGACFTKVESEIDLGLIIEAD